MTDTAMIMDISMYRAFISYYTIKHKAVAIIKI